MFLTTPFIDQVLPTKGRIMSAVPQPRTKTDRLPDAIPGEQSLIESARMEAFGRLACGVAHDFNNLLNGIMLYCDLLIAGLRPVISERSFAASSMALFSSDALTPMFTTIFSMRGI